MKRKLTQIITFLLALALGLGLTACGKKDTEKKQPPSIVGESTFTFDKKTPSDVTVTADLKGAEFGSVSLGGEELSETEMSHALADGKVVVTIYGAGLGFLSLGDHVYTLKSTGGECTFTISVVDNTPTDPVDPDTPVDPAETVSFYDNKSYNEYLMGDQTTIAGQWEGYGIGDPFIMRFDGAYYLYASTLDSEKGVRAWKSVDLVNWAQLTGEGLETGYVSSDPVTRAAYAPEVFYYDGTFYMYTSPGGGGHYVLTADDPAGPFVAATDNFGLSIDGSVFFDDDENIYFTRANQGGIRLHQMTDMLTVKTGSVMLDNVNLGGWTEGSYIIKRDGVYYITYTGNHVASDAYRIAYAVSEKTTSLYARSFFSQGANNPLALETKQDFRGIGHSSTVLGPDMDSYYLAYHTLNNAGGPNRSFNLDRLIFNGTQMSVSPRLTGSVAPALPAFYATGRDETKFDLSGGTLVSKTASDKNFTAEYNLTGINGSKLLFDYQDENNYSYASLDVTGKTISVARLTAGSETVLASAALNKTYDPAALHTVRIASRDGKLDLSFDNMTKIDNAAVTTAGGKIGYVLAEGSEASYTAFSNVAMGMSDEREVKQADMQIGASTFMTSEEYRKEPYRFSEGSGVEKISGEDAAEMAGTKALKLATIGDYATYLLRFDSFKTDKRGFYGLEMIYDKTYGGKEIGVQVDDGDVYMVKLPTFDEANGTAVDERFVRALVTEFEVADGIRQVRLLCRKDVVSFVSFGFVPTSQSTPLYEQSLSTYAAKGADYKTIWKLKDGGHYAKAGTRQLVYFGDETITDFTLEIEMKLEGATQTSTAGIVLRAGNYAASSHDNNNSIQGYYVSFNNAQSKLTKLDYDRSLTNMRLKLGANDSDAFFTVKIVARGNTLTVYKNGEQLFAATDAQAFVSGRIGLYTNGAAVVYKNLKISA